MTTVPVTTWGEALLTSLAAAIVLLFSAIPRLIGFVLIIVIGWMIARALGSVVAAVLRAARFDEFARRAGLDSFVDGLGLQTGPSGLMAIVVKWFVRLMTLVVAFDELGLPAVSSMLQMFVLWLPNLFVALLILVVGGIAANSLARIVRSATMTGELGNPDFLAGMTRVAIWGFTIIAAVNQIGIAATLVNALFIGFVAALALAFGLAFGLGARETAGQIVQDWYRRGRSVDRMADHLAERDLSASESDARAA